MNADITGLALTCIAFGFTTGTLFGLAVGLIAVGVWQIGRKG